jgi:hydrogenase-1 operon protein HyaF
VFLDPGDTAEALALLGMPSILRPATPRLPVDFEPGPLLRARLEQLRQAMASAAAGGDSQTLDMVELDANSRQSLLEMLGEGEVSGHVTLDGVDYAITESVLPGIWHLCGSDGNEYLEVGAVPAVITRAAASLRSAPLSLPAAAPGVMNGLALLAEINQHAAAWHPGIEHNRVLNFTLLPTSPADQQLLIDVLGRAQLVLDSGGFGNCRVMATTVRHVWAVQYVNGMGKTIMDTIEIGRIPDAALAARQDLEDSAERLAEILETYLS